jgi:glycosyltransferase involved in cell wall biosynthesis
MACGTPVITSNETALPEVAGGAALIVNPREPDAIAEAMVTVAGSESLRASLREKGLARVRDYSWEESAARMWQLLSREAET